MPGRRFTGWKCSWCADTFGLPVGVEPPQGPVSGLVICPNCAQGEAAFSEWVEKGRQGG